MKKSADDINTVLSNVVKILRNAEDIPFLTVLEMIASAFDCEVATYWSLDPKLQILREARSWYSTGVRAERLHIDTSKRTFHIGEGMPGRAWKFERPYLSNDLQMDMSLPRSTEVHDLGFKSGLWFPVKTEQSVLGVIELLGRNNISDDQEFRRFYEKFGPEVGLALHSRSSARKQ